jgi:glycosyltransferase involved in cell wall biosynthesis
MPLRVLHITPGLMIGGGQRIALDIVREMDRRPELAARLCVLGPPNDFFASASPVYVDYAGPYNDLRVMTRAALNLRKVLDTIRPDIVHTHAWELDLMCAAAMAGRDVAHVAHIHDLRHWLESKRFRHALTRAMTRVCRRMSCARYVAVSEFVRDAIHRRLGFNGTLVSVVHNGIDPAKYGGHMPEPDDPPSSTDAPCTVGAASRLASGKGIEVLLRAWQLAAARHGGARLRIAGTGELRPDLLKLAARLGLDDQVEFVGFVADMPGFYRSLDVFVLPSVAAEGMPMTVLEAMASQRPVVATRVGGTVEQVVDGECGLLVPPDDPTALAQAIIALLDDRLLRQTMGRRGRERVAGHFSTQAMVDGVVSIYRALGA